MTPPHFTPTEPDPRRWKALALLCTAFFMVILDSAIVVVALPSIGADLPFSESDLQWVLSAYLLSFGGLLLLGGRAADLLGRRRVFMAGTALFALASLGAGLAGSVTGLIVARVVQGTAAAVMTPTALSIVTTTFQEGAESDIGVHLEVGQHRVTDERHTGDPSGPGAAYAAYANDRRFFVLDALLGRIDRAGQGSGCCRHGGSG